MEKALDRVVGRVFDALVVDVQDSQRKRGLLASGKSAKSLQVQMVWNGKTFTAQLRGAGHWQFQQNGRGPGKGKYPSRRLVLAIKQWVKDKGLDIPPYAVAMKIHKEGIRVPNRFNAGGVLSDPLNGQRVANLLLPELRRYYIPNLRAQLLPKL